MVKYRLLFFTSLFAVLVANSQTVNLDKAVTAAQSHVNLLTNYKSTVEYLETYYSKNGNPMFFTFCIQPEGYVVISAREELTPVIAYSTTSSIKTNNSGINPLIDLLKVDLENRTNNISLQSGSVIGKHQKQWRDLVCEKQSKNKQFTQWPPEGTTSTGGWIETNWTQSSPYSQHCPIDPITGSRSYVGCPATAMAQIVNYYCTVNETVFSDDDDYYHSYAGRNYWIDDDYQDYDFLSFPEINKFLDTIAYMFLKEKDLTYKEAAALSFACGVAAHQVYTSECSGTFGVDQAWDAYQRFGFTEAVLLYESDTNFYNTMVQNMMDARPAHLAMVNQASSSGHNVVLDGYNTYNYFHINFGWGGTYNGWYLLPEEFPYGLTVFEGVVANIDYPVYTSVEEPLLQSEIEIYPVPASSYITINTNSTEPVNIKIINLAGKTVYNGTYQGDNITIDFNNLASVKITSGLYFVIAENNQMRASSKIIVN